MHLLYTCKKCTSNYSLKLKKLSCFCSFAFELLHSSASILFGSLYRTTSVKNKLKCKREKESPKKRLYRMIQPTSIPTGLLVLYYALLLQRYFNIIIQI